MAPLWPVGDSLRSDFEKWLHKLEFHLLDRMMHTDPVVFPGEVMTNICRVLGRDDNETWSVQSFIWDYLHEYHLSKDRTRPPVGPRPSNNLWPSIQRCYIERLEILPPIGEGGAKALSMQYADQILDTVRFLAGKRRLPFYEILKFYGVRSERESNQRGVKCEDKHKPDRKDKNKAGEKRTLPPVPLFSEDEPGGSETSSGGNTASTDGKLPDTPRPVHAELVLANAPVISKDDPPHQLTSMDTPMVLDEVEQRPPELRREELSSSGNEEYTPPQGLPNSRMEMDCQPEAPSSHSSTPTLIQPTPALTSTTNGHLPEAPVPRPPMRASPTTTTDKEKAYFWEVERLNDELDKERREASQLCATIRCLRDELYSQTKSHEFARKRWADDLESMAAVNGGLSQQVSELGSLKMESLASRNKELAWKVSELGEKLNRYELAKNGCKGLLDSRITQA